MASDILNYLIEAGAAADQCSGSGEIKCEVLVHQIGVEVRISFAPKPNQSNESVTLLDWKTLDAASTNLIVGAITRMHTAAMKSVAGAE